MMRKYKDVKIWEMEEESKKITAFKKGPRSFFKVHSRKVAISICIQIHNQIFKIN